MIWLVFALILLAALGLLLLPLLRRRDPAAARIDYDLLVYRDQLAELSRDKERGLLDEAQEEAARTEIQRRMLAAERAEEIFVAAGHLAGNEGRSRKFAAILAACLLPIGGFGLYLWLGHPELPGQPFASRQNDPAMQAASMLAHVQGQIAQKPSAQGYKVLGNLLAEMGRFPEAVEAYRKSLDLGEGDADLWSSFGEATVMVNGGSVVPEARQQFLTALRLDKGDARARFYLGLAESEIGNYAKAVAIWRDLQQDSPPDAPWRNMLAEHIQAFSKEGGFDPESVAPAPPTIPAGAAPMPPKAGVPTGGLAAAIAAAPPQDQQAMIRSMVDGLAAKLQNDPGNLDGWLRLARAYHVLGETAKAGEARDHAAKLIAALPAGSTQRNEAQSQLDSLMR
jgi:cytochrome c-type biogenesis protein CcmH